jgi:hypothetical protein
VTNVVHVIAVTVIQPLKFQIVVESTKFYDFPAEATEKKVVPLLLLVILDPSSVYYYFTLIIDIGIGWLVWLWVCFVGW